MKGTHSFFPSLLSRRAFLVLSGSVATGLFSACAGVGQPVQANPASPTPSKPTAAPTPTTPPTLTEDAWETLAQHLQGTLIRPGNAKYAVAHQLFNTRFDAIQPAGVVYCASSQDVQTCLAFVQRYQLPVTVRSGGHSYAGYSTTQGLLLDVTALANVSVDLTAGTATIGGGTHLIDVYSALSQEGVIIPAGSCPTVGIAGLTLGGGVGVLGRKFGLTSDSLLSAQVVLADGRLISCDAHTNADLFWALRGGGGGNFGVVTSLTFKVYPVTSLSLFTINWPWSSATQVVSAWQHWGPQAPNELWSNCLLLGPSNKNNDPLVRVNGVYVGGADALAPLLQQLRSQINAQPTSSYVYTDPLMETMMVEAGCYAETVAACHLPSQNPQGTVGRDTSQAKSDYVANTLPTAAIEVLVNAISARKTTPLLLNGGIGMDAYGGALNSVAADATAFVHRNALFSIQYTASWNANDSADVVTANRTWLNQTWQAMRPYVNGEAYQNYIDPDLPNWQQAYYGSNLTRLQQIKATYDPQNVFHFAQSITPV